MSDQWFINRKDGLGVQGPFDLAHLSQLVAQGEIAPQHEVRRGAIGLWADAVDLNWYFNQKDGSGVQGPVTRIQLREMLDENELNKSTEVRLGWDGDWQPIIAVLQQAESGFADDASFSLGADDEETDSHWEMEIVVDEMQDDEPQEVFSPDQDAWFCKISDQEQGPLPWSRVHSLASLGRMKRDDLIRHGSEHEWKAAEEFAGLFPKPSEASSPSPSPSPAPPQQINQQWYCLLGGMQMGPMTLDQLRGLMQDDRLKATDQVRPADNKTWVPAESVPGLFVAEAEVVEEEKPIPAAAPQASEENSDPPPPKPAEGPTGPVSEERRDKLQAWLDEEANKPKNTASKPATAKTKVAPASRMPPTKKQSASKPESTPPDLTDAAEEMDEEPPKKRGLFGIGKSGGTKKTAKPSKPKKKPKTRRSFSIDLSGLTSALNPKILGGIAGVAVLAAVAYGAMLWFSGGEDDDGPIRSSITTQQPPKPVEKPADKPVTEPKKTVKTNPSEKNKKFPSFDANKFRKSLGRDRD